MKRLEVIETDMNSILKSHLIYMESLEMHFTKIVSIENTLEQIALSSPFSGSGWQTKYIEEKIRKDLESWKPTEERHKDIKFYDDE